VFLLVSASGVCEGRVSAAQVHGPCGGVSHLDRMRQRAGVSVGERFRCL